MIVKVTFQDGKEMRWSGIKKVEYEETEQLTFADLQRGTFFREDTSGERLLNVVTGDGLYVGVRAVGSVKIVQNGAKVTLISREEWAK